LVHLNKKIGFLEVIMAIPGILRRLLGFKREEYIEPEHVIQKADTKLREWDNKELDPSRRKDTAISSSNISVITGHQAKKIQKNEVGIWNRAVRASGEYCDFLNMLENDIKKMSELNRYISINIMEGVFDGVTINLIPKYTCGCEYGGKWQYLLQPRVENRYIKGIGNGTSFVAILSDYGHLRVLELLEEKNYVIKNGSFWP
jgi:hypothetical protein